MTDQPTKAALIKTSNLSVSHGGARGSQNDVIRDLNLIIREHSFNLLLGPNGAGKTTLMKSLVSLISPRTGQIFFKGQPLSPEHRRQVAYLPEHHALPSALSSVEILTFRARLFGLKDTKQQVRQCCEHFKLTAFAERPVRHLSQGQKTRLAWAMTGLHDPELLILDEPFQGLDPPSQEEFWQWLHSWLQEGRSIILCTHDLNMLSPPWDQLLILRQGRICYQHDGETPWPSSSSLKPYFRNRTGEEEA